MAPRETYLSAAPRTPMNNPGYGFLRGMSRGLWNLPQDLADMSHTIAQYGRQVPAYMMSPDPTNFLFIESQPPQFYPRYDEMFPGGRYAGGLAGLAEATGEMVDPSDFVPGLGMVGNMATLGRRSDDVMDAIRGVNRTTQMMDVPDLMGARREGLLDEYKRQYKTLQLRNRAQQAIQRGSYSDDALELASTLKTEDIPELRKLKATADAWVAEAKRTGDMEMMGAAARESAYYREAMERFMSGKD